MELPFSEFDLIFGMDWLVNHGVNLDCAFKRVTLRTDENCKIVMIGEYRDYLSNVISTLVVEKLVWKGCKAYFAFVSNSGLTKLFVKDIRIVRDFPNVFLKELPGVPPDREVEFNIDLLLGITSMSITPISTAPKELAKLKAQIKKLLNRGFIKPNVSPWGALILFVKKRWYDENVYILPSVEQADNKE